MSILEQKLKEFARLVREHETACANGNEPDPASVLSQDCIRALIEVERTMGTFLTPAERANVLAGCGTLLRMMSEQG